MHFDRLFTAGLILGLAAGAAAFTHGSRTAHSTHPLVSQPTPQAQTIPASSNGLGIGP